MDAIVYTSNAGHTKEYAELLSLKAGIIDYSMEEAAQNLEKGSSVIYMGWLMAGGIKGYKEAAAKYDVKAVIAVGMTTGGVEIELMKKNNHIPEDTPTFYLQGGFEKSKLHGLYKFMMNIMAATVKKNLKKLPQRTEEENEMLDMMTYGRNMVNENKLVDVLAWYEQQK